ncbi:MAG TPA: VanZ family protein [Candidatus Competibacteraceae bacterium]|nr:VanZ family protein [Candidatus Competibacteraceae bacterium]HRZ05013.1 VanZ family protein [Candidatus Competibacteraceae bacterium]HSA47580.1 VanZ family protein [Candidatus Competibacteraceae bacterium]
MISNPAVSRKPLWILLLSYLSFVIYGSLIPLNFTPRPLDEALVAFQTIPFLQLGVEARVDWAVNLLLLIPVGFLTARLVTSKMGRPGQWLGSCGIILGCMVLAVTLEFTQLFFPPRVASRNDILAQSLGGVIGVVLQIRWGASVENGLLSLWQRENRIGRIDRLLYGYLLLLFAFNVMPLDLTLNPAEIYRHWSEGRIVLIPFSSLPGHWSEILYSLITDILIWIPAGLLWKIRTGDGLPAIIRRGLAAGLIIEILQIFIYSRVTDITDILWAGFGAALGALWVGRWNTTTTATLETIPVNLWITLWIAWACSVLSLFWYPFNFQFDTALPFAEQAKSLFNTPFMTYYQGSEYRALNEFLRKIGFFIPGGVLWILIIHSTGHTRHLRRMMLLGALAAGGIAALVEGGQLYLPGKVADFTDWVLEWTGTLLGMIATYWILSGRDTEPVISTPAQSTATFPAAQSVSRQTHRTWPEDVFWIIVISLLIMLAARLPFMPYNLRELIGEGGQSIRSALGLGLAAYWMTTGHLFVLIWVAHDRRWIIGLPIWILLHALVGGWLILSIAPVESLHDIVGSPVLNWPGNWEIFLRYLALHAAISLQVIGALLLIAGLTLRQGPAPWIYWLLIVGLMAPLLRWVIVDKAATDNLTELIRNGGDFSACALLALGMFCGFLTASALSVLTIFPVRSWKKLMVIVLTAAPLTYYFLESGSEPLVIKYDHVFSAFQFLLSTNRENYATGIELIERFTVAFMMTTALIAILQRPRWRALLQTATPGNTIDSVKSLKFLSATPASTRRPDRATHGGKRCGSLPVIPEA